MAQIGTERAVHYFSRKSGSWMTKIIKETLTINIWWNRNTFIYLNSKTKHYEH